MKKTLAKFDKPGEYSIEIPFSREGEQKEWLGIVDAREPGVYRLDVTALHTAPDTGGRITVRGVVGPGASLDLSGLIKIVRDAQHIDDFLELRVLLLDSTSRATAEPKLEIEADDVKASHAASVGKIDDEMILYLQSRGMSHDQACSEIVKGWLQL